MDFRTSHSHNLLASLTLATAMFLGAGGALAESALDPTRAVGSDECVDCHTPEHDVWTETTHFKTYDELSSSDQAEEIAEALGIDDIEDPEGACVGCHFTMMGDNVEDALPIAGISCESCHGAAIDWVSTHGEYAGGSMDEESDAQKQARISAAQAAGLLLPQRIHLIAANCLGCHTVPNEELVNVGGHRAGSDFELVDWSQGEVRHNLFWSQGAENTPASNERRRVMYVVGQATDLEYSLRALAKSTGPGSYRDSMVARIDAATTSLKAINNKISAADISSILAAAGSVDTSAPAPSAVGSAADKIGVAIAKFASSQDGSSLGSLDGMLPAGDGHYSEKY